MTCIHDLSPIRNDLVITHADEAFHWDSRWHSTAGVSALSITADIRNVGLGTSAAMAIKPAVQLAAVRSDRPDAGAAITAGSVITAAGLTHFVETLSASSKALFRVGWSAKLTAGSFARAEALLHVSYRACGRLFTPRELVFQPVNNTAAPSYFPLTGVFPTAGVDKGKLMIVGLDNANSTLQWRLAGRAFNDPMARGAWTNLEVGWNTPSTGDFTANTDEVSLSALSLSSYHWMELGLAVRKSADGDTNSRVIFHVTPAVTYL